jgi:uncharacterized UBP type Zn finger protein
MRVSLQFSVEFDELPERMVGFVRDACSKHEQLDALELLTTVESSIRDNNTKTAIDEISEFRRQLARIDFQLEDCINIIRDYHMALVGEVQPEQDSTTQDVAKTIPAPAHHDVAMNKLLGDLQTLQDMATSFDNDGKQDEQIEHG